MTGVTGAAFIITGLYSQHLVTATQLTTAGVELPSVLITGREDGLGLQHPDVAGLVHCAAAVAGHTVLVVVALAFAAETTPVVANARAISIASRETTCFFIGSSPFLHRRAVAASVP